MSDEKPTLSIDKDSYYGDTTRRWTLPNGDLHRDEEDRPAVIKTDMKGDLLLEAWYSHGKKHRLLGPAHIKYSPVYGPTSVWFYKGGKCSFGGFLGKIEDPDLKKHLLKKYL